VGWIVLFGMPVLSAQVPNQKPTREKQKRALEIVSISVWRKWLNEDVAYIITDQERGDFATLTSEQQRDQFITDFWERRNPNPGSPENAFKDEHYRRFAYANEHFATKLPGWKTNRGRIYIIYGPPDQVDNHFSAAGSESAERILGAGAIPYDWELWHYRYIDGVGKNVAIKFVDTCACGEYQIPVEKKDLKKYTPQ
jgi:GWxTD domain-containing protein